jgi:hypothetical protein
MMKSRTISAAALIAGIVAGASGALADVKVNTPGAQIDAPSGPVELHVNVDGKLKPSEAWVGRSVYSIDGKNLGEVAVIDGDKAYVDIGGFLGIGEHRILVSDSDIGSVTDERIVLKITEAEAKALPEAKAPEQAK